MRPIKKATFDNFNPQPKVYSLKKEKKPLKAKKKPTGERELHLAIWAVRKHVSYFSGEKIETPDPHNFMHVLPKSTYPKFRLYQKNIVLGTFDEHFMQTNLPRDKWEPEFRKAWERLEAELQIEYRQKHGT